MTNVTVTSEDVARAEKEIHLALNIGHDAFVRRMQIDTTTEAWVFERAKCLAYERAIESERQVLAYAAELLDKFYITHGETHEPGNGCSICTEYIWWLDQFRK